MKLKTEQSMQEWLPFDRIDDSGLIFYKNYFLKILRIYPINYDLKSNLEKQAILNSYKNFLKTCDFDIQILIQSKKEDISKTISQIQNAKDANEKIREIQEHYMDYIAELNAQKKSSSKNFFMLIKKKVSSMQKKEEDFTAEENKAYEYLNECYFKVKETLTRCGNVVDEINSKEEIVAVFESFIKEVETYRD